MSDRTISSLPAAWQNCALAKPDAEPAPASPRLLQLLEYRPALNDSALPVWDYPDNDDGNGAFFLAAFGNLIAWVPEVKLWRLYHNGMWFDDTTGRLPFFAQLLSRQECLRAERLKNQRAEELAEQVKNDGQPPKGKPMLTAKGIKNECRAALRRAERLGDEKVIAAMLLAASRSGRVVVPASLWDANPWIAGTVNGILDLKTGGHRAGRPEDRVTKALGCEYAPRAECPEWLKFISRVLPDADIAGYVQKLAGYSLTGTCDDQAFYFLHGSGKNGKSILMQSLVMLYGDYAGKARNNLIEENRNGADCKHDLAQLPGVRFLHGEETKQGGRLREETVKSLVAGDPVTGEAKYQSPFTFTPTAKLWLMGNHKPRIAGTDTGIWRRVRLIPFTETISEEEAVAPTVLLDRFRSELPGILNWLLDGLRMCPRGSIPMPASVAAAVSEYRAGEDELGDFISECTQDAAPGYKTPKLEVFARYQMWAAENGIRHSLTQKQLTRQLKERDTWIMDPRRECWLGKSIRS